MAIRVGIKALIVRDGRILLNRCRRGDKFTYYTLPGGGQRQYESVMQALEREIREETGLRVCLKNENPQVRVDFASVQGRNPKA